MSGSNPARFGVVGWKDTGKTTLVSRLVSELASRGYRVATVKHAHAGFDIDHPGTDSHAHRAAGAAEVAIVSSRRWAIMHDSKPDEPEASLDDIIARLSPCNLVLIEGFKSARHPKIEIRRSEDQQSPWLCESDPNIVALAFDQPGATPPTQLPSYQRGNVTMIADFVVETCGIGFPARKAAQ